MATNNTTTPFNFTNFVFPSSFTLSDNNAYITLGAIVLILNTTVFVILFSNKTLLRRSALITGITMGNFYLGCHLFCTALYRLIMGTRMNQKADLVSCVSIIIPLIYPLAFNTEALFLVSAGLERLLAIATPKFFYRKWTHKNSWIFSLVTHIVIWLMLLISLISPIPDRTRFDWSCSLISMFGSNQTRFFSAFSAGCGILGSFFTMTALGFGIRQIRNLPLASGEAGRIRRQVQLTKSMATISCFDIALMVIPNMISFLANIGFRFPAFIRAQNSTYTNACNGMIAFFAFLLLIAASDKLLFAYFGPRN